MVFTLPATTVRLLDAEYHDHRVMSFPLARARRIVLRFPGRTVALRHRPPQTRGQVEWVPEPGSDAEGIDLSRIGSLVATMSQLETLRFIQYDGELPADTGLAHPRLKVEVTLGPKDPTQVLRIGNNADDGDRLRGHGHRLLGAGVPPARPPLERADPLRREVPAPARRRLRRRLNPASRSGRLVQRDVASGLPIARPAKNRRTPLPARRKRPTRRVGPRPVGQPTGSAHRTAPGTEAIRPTSGDGP